MLEDIMVETLNVMPLDRREIHQDGLTSESVYNNASIAGDFTEEEWRENGQPRIGNLIDADFRVQMVHRDIGEHTRRDRQSAGSRRVFRVDGENAPRSELSENVFLCVS